MKGHHQQPATHQVLSPPDQLEEMGRQDCLDQEGRALNSRLDSYRSILTIKGDIVGAVLEVQGILSDYVQG